MSDGERLVKFELLGQEFKFYTAASEEEMSEILALIHEEVASGSDRSHATLSSSKMAVMACLNIASKYIQLKHELAEYKSDTDSRFNRLSEEIRSSLLTD